MQLVATPFFCSSVANYCLSWLIQGPMAEQTEKFTMPRNRIFVHYGQADRLKEGAQLPSIKTVRFKNYIYTWANFLRASKRQFPRVGKQSLHSCLRWQRSWRSGDPCQLVEPLATHGEASQVLGMVTIQMIQQKNCSPGSRLVQECSQKSLQKN